MARGISGLADVIQRTSDGRDLSELFAELQTATSIQNEQRQRFVDLFTYPVTSAVTSVLQTPGEGTAKFEEASEYGVPQSNRQTVDTLNLGATFRWLDAGWRASWQYLADASAAQIEANANAILEADQTNVFNEVMGTIFNNANRSVVDAKSESRFDVYAFANGDGWVPPAYAGNSFAGNHTHYRVSGAATVESGDLDEIITDLKSHGYSAENGAQIVIFVNTIEGDVINGFRVADGAKADFIPAAGARFYSPNQLVSSQPSSTFAGFPVKGAYDEALIVESSRIPVGYLVGLASGGSLATSNPIMFREHPNAALRGLRLVGGSSPDYPLQDSYWVRGFGTGVRHRLAGVVLQVKASGSYTPPSLYVAS